MKKAILPIDVDDTQFKGFLELFGKYQDQLKEMPEQWKGANEVLNAGIAAIAEQTHAIAKHLNSAITAQKQFANATHSSASGLKKMAKEAKSVADHIFGIGKFVLKLGAVGGGLFAGALYGIDKLAGSALSSARGARGIGVSPGALRAFGTDYRQIAPDNLPNSVYASQRDLTQLPLLAYAAGLSPTQAANMSPVAMSQLLVRQAHDYYLQNKNNPAMLSPQAGKMMGFAAGGLGIEDVTRAGNTPMRDILDAQSRFAVDKNRFNYDNNTLEGLRSFQYQLQAAGQALETNLSKHLSKLGPDLGGLVTTLEKDAEKLLNGALSDKNIAAIKSELDKFTTYLASGKAQDDIQSFASSLGDLAKVIHVIAHPYDSAVNGTTDLFEKAGNRLRNGYKLSELPDDVPGAKEAKAAIRAKLSAPVAGGVGPAGSRLSKAQEANLESALGLPAGSMAALIQTESSGRAGVVSKAGAIGLTQLMPGTAKGLGVTDPFDPVQNELGGARYFSQMRDFVHKLKPGASGMENMDMALAAYNMGPGAFQQFFKKHSGKDWMKFLPSETKREISSFSQNMAKIKENNGDTSILRQIARNTAAPTKIQVTMVTPTAARIATQANAAR